MSDQHDLEALKAVVKEAKAIHREAVKAIVEAKRVANNARGHLSDARMAYFKALPPSKRPKPRPKRVTNPDDLFAPSPPAAI